MRQSQIGPGRSLKLFRRLRFELVEASREQASFAKDLAVAEAKEGALAVIEMLEPIISARSQGHSYSTFLAPNLPATIAKISGENNLQTQAATSEWMGFSEKTHAFSFHGEFSQELQKIKHWLFP